MRNILGRSLPHLSFDLCLTEEIRNYYYLNNSLIYAGRWLEGIPSAERPARLGLFPGDDRAPFTSLDISIPDFIAAREDVAAALRENTIVTFVTAFEVYL